MKIALVALYFRPDQGIGSIRPENWVRWISASHQVEVITREDLHAADEDLPWSTLRRSGFLLKQLDKLNAWRKQRRLRQQVSGKPVTDNIVSREKAHAPSGIFTYRMPCLHDVWFLSCLRSLCKSRPDVIIATHSPYVTLLAAWVYALFHPKVKLWADFRDLWAGNHLATGAWGFRCIERWLERRILKRADVITTVSEGLADYFRELGFSRKTHVVYNAPPEPEASPAPPSAAPAAGNSSLKLCYTGTIYSGWRDPSPLFSMLQEVRDAPTPCTFQIASRNAGNLFELIERFGVSAQVDFLGAIDRTQAMQLQQAADVLVLLESAHPEAKGILTGKLFEYLATDKPILLLGPGPDSELYQLIDRHERLVTLEELRSALTGATSLKVGIPVDYREISRQRVTQLLGQLTEYTQT